MSNTPFDDAQSAASRILEQLGSGRIEQAGQLVADALAQFDDQPRLRYLEGLVLLARGRETEARRPLDIAARAFPDDAAVQANHALVLLRLGELEPALAAADRGLAAAPGHADGHFNRGLILSGLHRHDEAASALREAVRLRGGHRQAWTRLGILEHARGRYLEAELALQRALALEPGHAPSRIALAALLYDAGLFERCLVEADQAIAGAPDEARAHVLRSSALRRLGRLDEAAREVHRALQLAPADPNALKARGLIAQMQDRLEEAATDFVASARIRFAPGAVPDIGIRELRRASRAKLAHDIEQYQHLQTKGALPGAQALIDSHRQVLDQWPQSARDPQVLDLDLRQSTVLAGGFNRLHHLAEAPRLAGSALHGALDGRAITEAYAAREPGITWIDDFLSPEALALLRRYCLESTFWFDFHHANGYLGAFFEDGFAAPLLLQIAGELRQRMPEIFRDYPLTQLWAFKYDSRLDGIELHADIAAVNLNFWITPDEANLDPESGGLVVWDKAAPPEWGFDEFNTSTAQGQARIERFLHESGAQPVRVPHRCNRAVLFNSDLFHRTDSIRFREGYEQRRINITMLFGRREGRVT